MQKIDNAITSIPYDDFPVGIKYHIQEMLYNKIYNGETLTNLENLIFSLIKDEFIDLDFEIKTEDFKSFYESVENLIGYIPPSTETQLLDDPTLNLIWYLSSLGIEVGPLTFWGGLSPRNSYSTLDLIDDLCKELSNYPGFLGQIFPERLSKFGQNQLSFLWGMNPAYVNGLVRNFKANPEFRVTGASLQKLKNNIISKFATSTRYGATKIESITSLIDSYMSSEIDLLEFLEKIISELGRISTDIIVTYKELSTILIGSPNFFKELRRRIQNPRRSMYNPNYMFSLEQLDQFRRVLSQVLREDAQKSIELLDLYQETNPNLQRYQHQQFTVKNPDYFKEIDTTEKAYWFGFLLADGYHNPKTHITFFELKYGDRNRVIAFAKAVGIEPTRVRDRIGIYERDGEFIQFKKSYLSFSARPFTENFQANGFLDFKAEGIFPQFVKDLIETALEQGEHLSDSNEGKIALAFLLGFYDGDGSLDPNSRYARIYNTKKEFLLEVKSLYGIDNDIHMVKKEVFDEQTGKIVHKSVWALGLGSEFLNELMKSHQNSLRRKRVRII